MSVSIEEIKKILINSYSEIFGNIDTQYIIMTRFLETSPGVFDYTCELLIPQSKIFDSTLSTVQNTLDEISEFNKGKSSNQPTFVETKLQSNLVRNAQAVLGDRLHGLIDVNDNNALVRVKAFGKPRQIVTKKRRTVVNKEKNLPVIHSFAVEGTHDHVYNDVVSEGVTVFRRKDGSRYQHDAGTATTTELSPPDPTFVGYTYKGITRHGEQQVDALMTRTDVFDSFETPPNITGATFSAEDRVLLSGTVEPGILLHDTTVYAVLTSFPTLSDELLVAGAETINLLGNLSSDAETHLSLDQADAGSLVYVDADAGLERVESSAFNVVFVHLLANNDPFYASDTFRLERPGSFTDAPYVHIEPVEANEPAGYVDVVGTVYSSVRDVKNTRVVLFADVSVNETSEELRDFVRFYGAQQQPADRYSVTRFNHRFYKAYTNLSDAAETTSVVADKRYTAVVLAEDSYQTVSVETESVYVRPELRATLFTETQFESMFIPPTITYIDNNHTLRLEPSMLSLINGRITWVRLGNRLNTADGFAYEFTLSASTSRNRGDYFLMFGKSIDQHNVYDTEDLNAIIVNIADRRDLGFYTWTRHLNAWFSANNESLNPSNTEFASSEAFPDYWRVSMVVRSNGQRDALLQVFRDPERFDLVMYGYLSDVGRTGSHDEFQYPYMSIGFGCSVYDNGASGYAPDNVTFGDLTEFFTNRSPGIYENPLQDDGLLLSVRETDWGLALGSSPEYDLSVEDESIYYGKSCALSADAKVVVVGGYANDLIGGVVVMEYNPVFDGWGKHTADGRFEIGNQHRLIRTTDWDTPGSVGRAGESTDVSGDGKTLIVSGSVSNSYTSGYAVIYEYDDVTKEWGKFDANGAFTQGGYHDLSRSGALGRYGRVSRLSLNGKVAVVAGDAQHCAFVWTYDESTATWNMKQDLTLNKSNYGHSAAVSADGRTIVIGRSPSTVYGQMYVWKYDGVADAYVNTHLIHKNPTHGQFGFSVAVSADGRVVIGSGHKGHTSGCAFVYHYDESTDQWGRFDATDGSFVNNTPHDLSVTADANCKYGQTCSMSADGRTAIVSGSKGGDCFVWTYNNREWVVSGRIVNDTYNSGFEQYGEASDVSADGSMVVVSGPVSTSIGGVLLWRGRDIGGRALIDVHTKQLVGHMPSLTFRMRDAIAGLDDGVYDSSATLTYQNTIVSSGNDNFDLHQMFAGGYNIGTDTNGKKYFTNEYNKSFGEFNVGASDFTIAFVLSAKGYEYNGTSRLTYGVTPGNADLLNIHLSSTGFGYFPLKYPISVADPDRFMTSEYFLLVVSYNKDLDGGILSVMIRNRSTADAQTYRFVEVNGANTYNPSNTIDRIFTLWNQNKEPFRVFDMMIFPGEYVGGDDSPLLNQIEYDVRNEYGVVAPTPNPSTDRLFTSEIETLVGTGWTLIKSLSGNSKTWFPGNDNLQGYPGTEFLFARGDFSAWLITPHTQVHDVHSGIGFAHITKSSSSAFSPYNAKWYNRPTTHREDPWISLNDHSASVANKTIMYGENSTTIYTDSIHHSGMFVYTR